MKSFFFFFLAKAFNKKERKQQQKFCQSLKDSVEINLSKKDWSLFERFSSGENWDWNEWRKEKLKQKYILERQVKAEAQAWRPGLALMDITTQH